MKVKFKNQRKNVTFLNLWTKWKLNSKFRGIGEILWNLWIKWTNSKTQNQKNIYLWLKEIYLSVFVQHQFLCRSCNSPTRWVAYLL